MEKFDSASFFKLDLSRGFFSGILDAGFGIFILLLAIRTFEAPGYCKAILAGGTSIGLIANPVLLSLWGKRKTSDTGKCAVYMFLCSLFIFVASFGNEIISFTFFILLAQVSFAQVPSLMIGIYSRLYQKKERGLRVSLTLVMSTIGGMFTSYILGKYLDIQEADHRWVLWAMGFSALFSSLILFFMPPVNSQNENLSISIRIRNIFKIPFEDSLFLRVLIAWMILGFGAIMTFPLRVEYLADKNGMNMSNEEIALLGVALFFSAKVLGTLICGKLFDQVHFMQYRITLNLLMLVSIIVYFHSTTLIGVAIGTILGGIAMGGASLAWNLWVTKLAPLGRESEYMGVHVALTGIRGTTAPFIGYLLLEPFGFSGVSILSASLISLATILFATTLKNSRFST